MSTSTMTAVNVRQARALVERRAQLEHRVDQYTAAVRESNGHHPSLGRELDAASSVLAQVRAELARLSGDGGPSAGRDTGAG